MTVNHGVLGSSPREGAKAGAFASAFLFFRTMATVYIIFSESIKKFYIGYTNDTVQIRLEKHNSEYYDNKYTSIGIPWIQFLEIQCKSVSQAIKVEKHIKEMKSKVYIQNLKKYPELVQKLIERFN